MISFETSQPKWASPLLEGRTSWIFSSCGRCSRLKTGSSGTRSGGLRKGQSPCELLGGLSGFLSRRCRGLRPCVEWVKEPEDSSPVLTWILGYFWSLLSGVSPFLELRQVLSNYDGDLRDPLWWPQERPVPMRVPRVPFGIPLPSMPGPKTLCGVGAGN